MNTRFRWILFGVIGLFILFVLSDALGVFDTKNYFEVPHGSHTHFVPKDCDPPLPVSRSPTRRPQPGQHVDCGTGKIVSDG